MKPDDIFDLLDRWFERPALLLMTGVLLFALAGIVTRF